MVGRRSTEQNNWYPNMDNVPAAAHRTTPVGVGPTRFNEHPRAPLLISHQCRHSGCLCRIYLLRAVVGGFFFWWQDIPTPAPLLFSAKNMRSGVRQKARGASSSTSKKKVRRCSWCKHFIEQQSTARQLQPAARSESENEVTPDRRLSVSVRSEAPFRMWYLESRTGKCVGFAWGAPTLLPVFACLLLPQRQA